MCKAKIMCKIVIYYGSKIMLFCGQEMIRHLVVLYCLIKKQYK